MRAIEEDGFDDQEYIKMVFLESIASIRSKGQAKDIKDFAKKLITDKKIRKEVNDEIKKV